MVIVVVVVVAVASSISILSQIVFSIVATLSTIGNTDKLHELRALVNKNDVGHFVSIAAVSRYLRVSRYQKVSSPQRYWYREK